MFFQKLLFVLALWFLVEWAYTEKLKPFLLSEFGVPPPAPVVSPPKQDSIQPPVPAADSFLPHVHPRPPVPGMNTGKYVYGLDISHWDGNEANILERKKDSITFVICKATEGEAIIDSAFNRNWREIKQKSFIRGAYHFYKCAEDPVKQAAHFYSVVGEIDSTDFPPLIDIEEKSFTGNFRKATIEKNIFIFLAEVERLTKRCPVVYTDINTGNAYLKDTAFANYPLWIAYYEQKGPHVPKPWKKRGWAIWQKSEKYPLDGYADDFDAFNGGVEALKLFILIHRQEQRKK